MHPLLQKFNLVLSICFHDFVEVEVSRGEVESATSTATSMEVIQMCPYIRKIIKLLNTACYNQHKQFYGRNRFSYFLRRTVKYFSPLIEIQTKETWFRRKFFSLLVTFVIAQRTIGVKPSIFSTFILSLELFNDPFRCGENRRTSEESEAPVGSWSTLKDSRILKADRNFSKSIAINHQQVHLSIPNHSRTMDTTEVRRLFIYAICSALCGAHLGLL